MLALQEDWCWLVEDSEKEKPLPLGLEVKGMVPELGMAVVVVTLEPMFVKLKLSLGCLD